MAELTADTGLAGERKARVSAYLRERSGKILAGMVAVWVFLGGFVLFEPSPYELMFVALLPVALFGAVSLHRATLPLLAIFIFFIPFAIIGAFQSTFFELSKALIFVVVTIFLLFTSYFVANYVADAPQERMGGMVKAYTWAAVLSALVGTLAYLGVLPGAELFLRYGRAKAAFEDPNVFGPFLILPAMFALQKVLLGTPKQVFWASIVFMIIFIGVFVSFSRAAWGHMVLSSLMVFVLGFALRADAREKVRMLILAMVGAGLLMVALIGLLSIPEVADLFAQRASAEQNYDTGETGRFGRQAYAFDLALANPWGIGPGEFFNLRITEQPHNTYVSVLHVYGWGGGLAFYLFILLTLWHGFRLLATPSANRMLMIPLISVFFPLALEAAIIDTDHWRHLFLVAGMIWGVAAGYWRVPKGQGAHQAALI